MIESGIVISQFRPSPEGHGGEHRAYQLRHDLESVLGQDRVEVISVGSGSGGQGKAPLGARFARAIRRRTRRNLANPLRFAWGGLFDTTSWATLQVRDSFRQALAAARGTCIILVGHVGLADLVDLARQALGRRALLVLSSQNLESLDAAWWPHLSRPQRLCAALDLLDELSATSRFDRRIAISRVEASFLSGIGLGTEVHAYIPVGRIRERLLAVRERRAGHSETSNVLLVLGSAVHPPTGRAVEAVIRRLLDSPPLRSCEIHLAGHGTQRWQALDPAVTAHGWVGDGELAELLVRARLVVAPHAGGFGALTRLPELACAGIPVWAPLQAGWAQDLPPGVAIWNPAERGMPPVPSQCTTDQFDQWVEMQPQALAGLVRDVP